MFSSLDLLIYQLWTKFDEFIMMMVVAITMAMKRNWCEDVDNEVAYRPVRCAAMPPSSLAALVHHAHKQVMIQFSNVFNASRSYCIILFFILYLEVLFNC